MIKTDVKKALEESCKSKFINVSGIATALGKSRDYARNLVHGLDYLPDGRAKNYLVSDVAENYGQESTIKEGEEGWVN